MITSRKTVIQFIFILVGIIFIVRLFFIQVVDSTYKFEAQNNVMRRVIEYPYRGLIYDRNGKLLVYNTPVIDLMVTMKELKISDTAKFCSDFSITKEEFLSIIKKMKQDKGYSSVKPMPFLKQLSITDFAKIQDHLIDYKGFYPQARTIRSYPHTSLANALGYIGEISKRQLENQKENYYLQGDYIGISGLEASYEKELRGKRGARYLMVNVKGVEKGSYKNGQYDTLSIPGENLISTIDLELQQYGEKLMQNKVGSIVAIEPATGEILAFISAPSYDPNLLTGRKFSENYRKLESDSLKPLFNRPLMAMYPPGSIFKLAQALVGQQIGVVKPTTSYPCNQSWGPKCHPHPSPVDLKGSIQYSCNPYYYMVFKNMIYQNKHENKFKDSEIGFDQWRDLIISFGFGQKLAIDLPNVKSGYIPTNSFYDRIHGDLRWKHSTIRSLDIGQGELLIVPLQMANMAAIIANKGYYYTPHLIKAIGEDKKVPAEYKTKHYVKVEPKYFPVIADGMEMVMSGGTAASSRIKDIVICGKTGTVQNPHGEDHSVFIAYAPKDDPKIAIATYVENAGFGGVWAAPISSLMIEKYLKDTITRPHIEKRILEKDFINKKPKTVSSSTR
ncbi:MAG TPA: penicillin-binding protein 2 [Cytophagaceae bacterium]